MFTVIKGDLIKLAQAGEFNIIAHGCNCCHTMGAGIAKQIKDTWPLSYEVDKETERNDFNKLGTYSITAAEYGNNNLFIMNMYTQYNPGKDLCYPALDLCLRKLQFISKGLKVGMPLIGGGLAGGDKKIIVDMMKKYSQDYAEFDWTLVEYDPD